MEFFEKKISHLIEQQFPDFYQEEGPVFIDFVKKYYEWMESPNNAIYHSRRLLEYGDIDSTVDDFLIYFKSKYLNSIQFNTATNTRQLIKHSLDLYRSKGTTQSIDLFFKEVFGKKAEVYFPADDMFRLSAGEWIEPTYLEVSYQDDLKDFIGYQIQGLESRATAFVDKYIRKKINGRYIEILYITDIKGDFKTGEKIATADLEELETALDVNHKIEIIGPVVIGSLTTLDIISGGENYSIGDIVDIYSETGVQAKARVSGISNTIGTVKFTLNDGGWGYNSNSVLIISNNIITVSDVFVGTNNNTQTTFNQFETFIQPLANVFYTDLSGEALANGDFVYRYDPETGNILSEARVLSINTVSNTTGSMVISIYDGRRFNPSSNFNTEDDFNLVTERGLSIGSEDLTWSDTHIYHDEANTDFDFAFEDESSNSIIGIEQSSFFKHHRLIQQNGTLLMFEDDSGIALEDFVSEAVIYTFDDISAIANVMTSSTNTNLFITGSLGTKFVVGDEVFQYNDLLDEAANGTIESINYTGSNAIIKVIDVEGSFSKNERLESRLTTANAIISNLNIDVAVFQVENTFLSTNGNIIYGVYSNTHAEAIRVSSGVGANISISNTFLYNESVDIATDYIYEYLDVPIDGEDWGFATQANLNTIIANAFSYITRTYGTISDITLTSPGIGYDNIPYVFVYEPTLINYEKKDFILNIENVTGLFTVGEVIKQSGVNKGIVKAGSNSSVLYLKRITFDDTFDESFIISTEAEDYIVDETESLSIFSEQGDDIFGVQSGSIARIVSYFEDASSYISGFNANITSQVTISTGTVTDLEIVDSGHGYYQDDLVTFYSNNNPSVGQALINLGKQGKGVGYYRRNDSLLSSNKYLQDSFYYQEFSYEIQSPIALDRYKDMLKNILHIAGTKSFSRYVSETKINIGKDAKDTVVTIE